MSARVLAQLSHGALTYELTVTRHKLQAASCKLQAASCKLQATSYKLQLRSGHELADAGRPRPLCTGRAGIPVARAMPYGPCTAAPFALSPIGPYWTRLAQASPPLWQYPFEREILWGPLTGIQVHLEIPPRLRQDFMQIPPRFR